MRDDKSTFIMDIMEFSIRQHPVHPSSSQLLYIDGKFSGASVDRCSQLSTVTVLWYSHSADIDNSLDWVNVFCSLLADGKKIEYRTGECTKIQYWSEFTIEDEDNSVLNKLLKYGFKI